MANQIVNDNKLTLILTEYGLERVGEALNDVSVELSLSKIKLGAGKYNAETDSYEYYEPTKEVTTLESPIEGAEFYLIDKTLLEDGLTVCLHAVIPEDSGGYDVREVGLYETVNGEDKLFAISTQQPLVKPLMSDNYLIVVDYYMFLKSQNFASVYDQIIINSETGLVTYTDLDQYLKTVLFAQASLMDQIGHNSYIIGLDRAGQLSQKINSDRDDFGYWSMYNSYTSLLDSVNSDNVMGFWVFDYPRRTALISEVTDISKNKTNMNCDKSITMYERDYFGIFPTLGFTTPHFYEIPAGVNISLLNYDETADADFSMLFCVAPTEDEGTRTLLAKSNEALGTKVFEVEEVDNRALQITLYKDDENYIRYTTLNLFAYAYIQNYVWVKDTEITSSTVLYNEDGTVYTGSDFIVAEVNGTYRIQYVDGSYRYNTTRSQFKDVKSLDGSPHALIISYKATTHDMYAYLNGVEVPLIEETAGTYDHMNANALSVLYGWKCIPEEYIYTTSTDPQSISDLRNSDGTPVASGGHWSVNSGVFYDTTEATYQNTHIDTIPLYAYSYSTNTIWANESTPSSSTILYNSDYTLYNESAFEVIEIGETYVIQWDGHDTTRDSAQDIASIPLYTFKATLDQVSTLANSPTNPGVFYIYDPETGSYTRDTSGDWTNFNGSVFYDRLEVDGVVIKVGYQASYDSSLNVNVQNLGITSYLTNAEGTPYNDVNSFVSVISIIKELLPISKMKELSLIFSSGMGVNPCISNYQEE